VWSFIRVEFPVVSLVNLVRGMTITVPKEAWVPESWFIAAGL